MSTQAFAFQHPANVLIVGPTGSGKTSFLEQALKNNQFEPAPERIVWIYSEMQKAYEELGKRAELGLLGPCRQIEFLKDDTDYGAIYDSMDPSKENMLVLDDQMSEASSGGKSALTELAKLFTKGSHHRRITIVFILQNAFEKGLRTVSLQANYFVLMKNPREDAQVARLAQTMNRRMQRFLLDAFADATQEPFSHMLIDMRQDTPNQLRYLTSVTGPVTYAYLPRDGDI